MPITYKALIAAADAVVPRISAAEAKEMIARNDALVIDVRDGLELQQTGKLCCALHIPRGSLEGRADPESSSFNPAFTYDRPILLHCAGGGRAALAGKTLKELGYRNVFNAGGFKDLKEAGIDVESM